MSTSPASAGRPRPRRAEAGPRSTKAREAGLEMVRRINRWLIAGAVAAAGAFSLLAANAFHGHAVTSSARSQSSSPPASSSSGLQAPAQAPTPAPAAPAPVVSGGS